MPVKLHGPLPVRHPACCFENGIMWDGCDLLLGREIGAPLGLLACWG